MNAIHHALLATAASVAALSPLSAPAQHDHHALQASAAPAAATEMSEGEVRKVDLGSRKITLKHGPLKNLGMPGMTMAFEVNDPAMLTKVKVGDNVRFVANEQGGKLRIMRIEAAK